MRVAGKIGAVSSKCAARFSLLGVAKKFGDEFDERKAAIKAVSPHIGEMFGGQAL